MDRLTPLSSLPYMWVDFINVSISDLSLCLPPCYYQQSPVQSWLEKEWEECVCEAQSLLLNPLTTPSMANVTAGDSESGVDVVRGIITGATEAVCPVLRAGK